MKKIIIEYNNKIIDNFKFSFEINSSLINTNYDQLNNFALIDDLIKIMVNEFKVKLNFYNGNIKVILSGTEYLIWTIDIYKKDDIIDYDVIDWIGSNKKVHYQQKNT